MMSYFYTNVEFNGTTKKLIGFKDGNGQVWWLGDHEDNNEYLAWVADGNTAEEWEGN